MSLGNLFVTVGADISGFKAAMGDVNGALTEAERQAGKATAGWSAMFSSLQSVGLTLTAAVTAPLVGVGAAAVSVSEHLNMARLGFETMLGSAQAAGAFLKELQAFAAATPFEFPELVDAAKRMMAMGFAAKDVVPTLRIIGDATAALGGGAQMIDRVTLALGQMSAKGKVSAQEMNQLAEQGIPAWQLLADKIGKSIPEAMKLAEQGAIAASVAIPAILDGMNDRFSGQMQKASQTLTGVWSNFKDQVTFALGDIGTTLAPVLTQIIQDFGIPMLNMVRDLTSAFASLDPETQKIILGVAALAAAVGPVLLAVGTLGQAIIGVQAAIAVLGPALAGIGGLLGALTGPIGLTVAAIAGLGTVAYLVWKDWDTVKGRLLNIWDTLTGSATAVTKANNLMTKGMYDLTEAEKEMQRYAEDTTGKLTKKAEAVRVVTVAQKESTESSRELAAAIRLVATETDPTTSKITQMRAAVDLIRTSWQNGKVPLETYLIAQRNLNEELKRVRIAELEKQVKDLTDRYKAGLISTDEFTSGTAALTNELERLRPSLASATPTAAALAEQLANLNAKILGTSTVMVNAETAAILFETTMAGIDLTPPREQVQALGEDCLSLPSKSGPALEKTKGQFDTFSNQVSTIFTDLSRRVTDILFDGDMSWGAKGKAMLDELGKSVTRLFVEPATAAISNFMNGILKDLLGGKGFGGILDGLKEIGGAISGVFGGGGGAVQTATGAAGSAGGGAGSVAGAAGGGAASIVGAIGSIGSFISGVIGNFQNARQETTLNAIEESTRYTKILTDDMKADHWSRFNQLMPKLDDLWNEIKAVHHNITGGVFEKLDWITNEARNIVAKLDGVIGIQQAAIAGMDVNFDMLAHALKADNRPHVTINVTGTLDGQAIAEAVYDELQRRGVTK